jgi:hypothetical protein
MLKNITKALALTVALATGVTLMAPGSAEAGGRGKEYFSQTYVTKQPLHGYEGRAGDYYCSYVRIPVHKVINGRMKVVAWTLQQHCY